MSKVNLQFNLNKFKIVSNHLWLFFHYFSIIVLHCLNTLRILFYSKKCNKSSCQTNSAKWSVLKYVKNNNWRWVSNVLNIFCCLTVNQSVFFLVAHLITSEFLEKSWFISFNSDWSHFRKLKWSTLFLRFTVSQKSLILIHCWRYSHYALNVVILCFLWHKYTSDFFLMTKDYLLSQTSWLFLFLFYFIFNLIFH